MAALTKEHSIEIQQLFLEMMIQDPETYVRVQNIYNPENFDRKLRETAKFIQAHSTAYKSLPTYEQISAVTRIQLMPVPDLNKSHYDWFLEEFEGFTKRRELERAILLSADLLEKGEFEPVEKLIRDAVQVSLIRDLGLDYFLNPKQRLLELRSSNSLISTGWPTLDYRIDGGANKGELNIFAGSSGSGKSLIMQNIAANWIVMGLCGIYVTLELSEGLTAKRLDSMLSGVGTREVFKNLDDVELKVKMLGKTAGSLQIKYMPAQSNVNQIRAYVRELQVQTGIKVDFIMVDYLDLVMPSSVKVNPSDLFVKDKFVSEELRNLGKEENLLMVTASQLNRTAIGEEEFDHTHIAGGISKINTADNVFGIFTSRAMKERGRYQIHLMKTRSSGGVGQKIELGFNIDTLRITDIGEDQQGVNGASATSMLSKIKTKSTVSPKSVADDQTSKLQDMFAKLKQSG